MWLFSANFSKLFLLREKSAINTFAEIPKIKINRLNNQIHEYLIQTWSDKAFKIAVLNRALPPLHEGLFKITFNYEEKISMLKKPFRKKTLPEFSFCRIFEAWNVRLRPTTLYCKKYRDYKFRVLIFAKMYCKLFLTIFSIFNIFLIANNICGHRF